MNINLGIRQSGGCRELLSPLASTEKQPSEFGGGGGRRTVKIFMTGSGCSMDGDHGLPKKDRVPTLVAPYCGDTARLSQRLPPYCALWGFWCLNMGNWVRYPLPLF